MNTILLLSTWDWVQSKIGDERLTNILWCIGIIAATMLLKKPLSRLISRLTCSIATRMSDKQHALKFRSLIVRPVELLLQTILFYIAINQLHIFLGQVIFRRQREDRLIEIRISDVSDMLFLFLIILFIIWTISRVLDFIFYVLIEKAEDEHNREKAQLFPLLKEVTKILVWTTGAFWVMGSVFRVNIPALITGLGIGGVAIALAAKETVENFFAAFTILTDKPFQTGDTVKLGSLEGKVERIGFRSCRMRNPDGSLYVIPNKKLVNENLENLTQRDARRMRIVVNLKYGLPHYQLQQMIDELRAMLAETLHVIDPIDVALESFGENVFQLVISYHLPDPLAEGGNVGAIKQTISMKTYEIVSKYTDEVSVQANPTQAPSQDPPEGSETEEEKTEE
jgi:MscS family membrane protein